MADQNLITITDVQGYRRIDPKMPTEKFNAFLREVQRRNLKDFLGDALYLDLMNDYSAQKYVDLISGKTYTYQNETIEFYGLKPILVYWWLAIAAREGSMFLSNYGAVQFVNNPQQQFESSKEKERIALGYLETAGGYKNDAVKFLDTNYADYPLWETKGQTKTNNLTTFKI